MHETTAVLIALFIMFAAAKLLGEVFARLHQPAVVGEILAGVLIGPSVLGWVHPTPFLDILAELAVILLLFRVGLEVHLREMMAVGWVALAVAVLGVALPFLAGVGLMHFWLDESTPVALFMGAAMVATSVGITARVLSDLGQLQRREAHTILGAAVIDDVLGLLVLAIVAGIAVGGAVSWLNLGVTIGATLGFVAAVLALARPLLIRYRQRLVAGEGKRTAFFVVIALMLGLSALSAEIGLAAIVGAFFAGLIVELGEDHRALEQQIEPVSEFLVPFFFVSVGMKVELDAFLHPETLLVTAVVLVLAMVTKVAAGWLAAYRDGFLSASVIGVGMMPRGEVGIIVALYGLNLGVVTHDLYSVVVAMSVLTTLIAPPVLKALLTRLVRQEDEARADEMAAGELGVDTGR